MLRTQLALNVTFVIYFLSTVAFHLEQQLKTVTPCDTHWSHTVLSSEKKFWIRALQNGCATFLWYNLSSTAALQGFAAISPLFFTFKTRIANTNGLQGVVTTVAASCKLPQAAGPVWTHAGAAVVT